MWQYASRLMKKIDRVLQNLAMRIAFALPGSGCRPFPSAAEIFAAQSASRVDSGSVLTPVIVVTARGVGGSSGIVRSAG